MTSLLHDLRFGLRLLWRHRGSSLLTLLVLGAGTGVVTTVVSIANGLLLRPMALGEPETLVRVFSGRYSGTPLLDLLAYDEASTTLGGIAAFRELRLSVRIADGNAQPLFGTLVTGNYFDVLGVGARRGRTFLPGEARTPGSSPVAVLSHRAWQRHFGSDPDVVGRPILVNGQPVTVVGIMPESFTGAWGPIATDVWLPVTLLPVLQPGARTFVEREAFYAQAIARLRPGATIAQAQAEADSRYRQWQHDGSPQMRERSALRLYPAQYLVPELRERVGVFIAILGALTTSMLGIVCLNVANLLLARNATRTGELGIRIAVGAGRVRLLRQLLIECGCLAAGGAILGVGLTLLLTRAMGRWTPPAPVPIVVDVTPDWRVFVAVAVGGALTTLLFGLAPAWSAARHAVAPMAGSGSLRATAAGGGRLRGALMIAQLSLSLVLLVLAGLLVRSLYRAERMNLGFEPSGVLMTTIDLDVNGYSPARGRQLMTELVARVRALPGVRDASLLDVVPLTGSSRGGPMLKEGVPPPRPGGTEGLVTVGRKSIGDGHFSTLRITMLLGRDFTSADNDSSPAVAIVNETLARTLWPGQPPIGRRLRAYDPDRPDTPLIEVVGLVRDSKYVSVGESPRPFLYRPLAQEYSADAVLILRGDGDPLAFAPAVRDTLRQLDRDLSVFEMRTLTDATSLSLLPIRLAASVVAALAMAVLGLAAIGIYGVLSFLVRQRTREIGIQMALGADRGRILASVLGDALRWIGWGVASGLVLALAAAPLVSSLLYETAPRDVPTLVTVTGALVLVGIAAAFAPALRATRLSPSEALRNE